MAGAFNKEQRPELKETVETDLHICQPELTASSTIPPTCKSDFEIELVSTPPRSLRSPWIISIHEKLEQARQYEASSSWANQSIYRVPKALRDIDETAYNPQTVSLGPHHRGCFRDMDHHKWRALHHVLHRNGHDIGLYLDAARSLEDRARACYGAPLSISSDEFVESLVLDSIFALELLLGICGDFRELGYDTNDVVFSNRNKVTMLTIVRDMILLENQIPLFVLDRIIALQRIDHILVLLPGLELPTSGPVALLAFNSFCNLISLGDDSPFDYSSNPLSDAGTSEALHCLDVFRRSLLLAGPEPASRLRSMRRRRFIHCVAELRNAGIKFRRQKSKPFWDIKFEDGVLHIPRLRIRDVTKSLFRNLIAFELCHLERSCRHITSYAIFMNSLINSEVDVGYLHRRGIIDNGLGNDGEVADMFNRLCLKVVYDIKDCYLSELTDQVNCFYDQKCNSWRASLTHKYFSNPWSIIFLVAAVVLLLPTSVRTFYTIYDYYKPNG